MRISDWSSDVCSSDLGVKSELLIDCGLWVAPLFWVMDLITSGMLVKPLALICSAVITLIGEGPSICERGMREPVTCTACSSVVSGSAGAGGGGGAIGGASCRDTGAGAYGSRCGA